KNPLLQPLQIPGDSVVFRSPPGDGQNLMISARLPPSVVPGSLVLTGFQKDRPILLRYSGNPEQDAGMRAPSPLDVRRPAHDSSCPGVKEGLQRTVRLNRCRRRRLIIRTDCRVARVGPTTPTRARRLYDASVDPTEARKATVRRFGRSD